MTFQQIVNGFPEHASHNLAKTVLDWEYVVEILRARLRMCLADQQQARPERTSSSYEGSIPQDLGASYAQNIPSEQQVPGGVCHV